MTLPRTILSAAAACALAVYIACGGGGGGAPAPVAPTITTQPANQTVAAGATATFSVAAAGTAPLSYQWKKGGTAITGATSASYTTPATVPGDNGSSFTVTVTNAAGSITSSAAVLTVTTQAPAITTQPANQFVLAGATATFSVTATGTAPLSYQWKKNGVDITTGGTSATYTTPATVVGDSGSSFTVTVTNTAGSVTSSAATLTVSPLAASLVYTDPTTGTYLLKKNTTLSTATHLVLDLVGPAATTGSGVTATFTVDAAKVSWANVASGDPASTFVQNGTAFTLGSAPQILKGKVAAGVLQVAAAQKGTASPVSLNQPLLRVALDLKASQTTGAITLSAGDTTKCQVLDGSGNLTGIAITVGTLAAQ